MTISLGLDIGTNSVGSAWVDTEKQTVDLGVSIFPAGVEQRNDRRGAPKNQARRQKRSQRRTIHRRAQRKRNLRGLLTQYGLLPDNPDELRRIFGPRHVNEVFDLEKWNPWHLRRAAIQRPLELHEFGRVLIHLNQRRGSAEIRLHGEFDPEETQRAIDEESENEEDKSPKNERKKATAAVQRAYRQRGGKTFGQFMADEYDKRLILEDSHIRYRNPVRNLRDKLLETNSDALLANRELIQHEFEAIWSHQESQDGELGRFLRSSPGKELRKRILDPSLSGLDKHKRAVWREGGAIFGQRKTYWNVSTLGRCELEPTDRCAFKIDRYAQQFRVLETVNNIRINGLCLSREVRDDLISYLSTPQSDTNKKEKRVEKSKASVADVKQRLGLDDESLDHKGIPRGSIESSLDKLGDRDINSDWFSRQIICGVFGESNWNTLDESKQDHVNRETQRLDPESDTHAEILRKTAIEKWDLSTEAADKLVRVWLDRPKLDRVNRSRRAICNLLPYLHDAFTDLERSEEGQTRLYWLDKNEFRSDCHRWLTEIEARQAFAENPNAQDVLSGKLLTDMQRRQKDKEGKVFWIKVGHEVRLRYAHTVTEAVRALVLNELGGDEDRYERALRIRGLSKRDLHYLKKHPDQLLPPAPELSNPVVRKSVHVVREHVIQHLRNHGCLPDQIVIELARDIRQTAKVRDAMQIRNDNRNAIRKSIAEKWQRITNGDPRHPAVERVLLCRQQNFTCPYSGIPKGKLVTADEGACVYSGRAISEQRAASGDGVEVDHIVPRSRGGDDGLNNKVLCYASENRRKANQTPKQSLSTAQFEELEAAMRHLKRKPANEDYFTKKDYLRKWENLHSDAHPTDFRASQLNETAYAAAEVGRYLRAALFPNEPHRVVFTKGSYTNVLRKDWRLMKRLPDPWREGLSDEERKRRRELLAKNRDDHRHHAVDAVIIALTVNLREPHKDYLDDLKRDLEQLEEEVEKLRERNLPLSDNWPKRLPLLPPWPHVRNDADANERNRAWQAFRRDVLSHVYAEFEVMHSRSKGDGTETGQPLIVSHRPLRGLYGALHEDTAYGAAREFPGLYITRKYITELKPGHFISPCQETDGSWKIPGKGQGQAIRDPCLRDDLLSCLASGRVSVTSDDFAKKSQLEALVNLNCLEPAPDLSMKWADIKTWLDLKRPCIQIDLGPEAKASIPHQWRSDKAKKAFSSAVKIIDRQGGFRTRSGIPIRSIRLLLALSNAMPIEKADHYDNRIVVRYFKGGNNHHLLVFENEKDGKWIGETRTMKDVADRNRSRLLAIRDALKVAGVPPMFELRKDRSKHDGFKPVISRITSKINREIPLVDHSDRKGKKFRLSLSIGDMVKLYNKDRQPELFQVVEVKKSPVETRQAQNKVVLVPHWDARKAKGEGVYNPRIEYELSAGQIQELVVDFQELKARVDPLGGIRWAKD